MSKKLSDLPEVTEVKSRSVVTMVLVFCLQIWWSSHYKSPQEGLKKHFK